MTNSSQPKNSSTSLTNDLFTITSTGIDSFSIDALPNTTDINCITITSGSGVYTIGSSNDTITLDSNYDFNWGAAQEWVDSFPDWQRVQDMCKKYPGLDIALRNFQTIYTLVKDDYDNPKDEK
jgi:hypothetical protein